MPRIQQLTVENYRSVQEQIIINFPENTPVVLIGENNSGKTNLIRAVDILFGEWHPKYKDFDDHDFYGRNPDSGTEIIIEARVSDFSEKLGKYKLFTCGGFKLTSKKGKENEYEAIQLEDGKPYPYVNNTLREELSSIIVTSEQNLSYQLSYSSKFTLLSKVTKTFHEKLVSDSERVKSLKGIFEQTLKVFEEVAEFKNFKENMSSITGEMIQNMSHGLQLDFSAYDPSNYFRTLRVNPSEKNQIRSFEELGTGQQQILALSFAHAYAKSFKGQGLIFILDEPETHLHPLAQKWLAKTMFQMANDGLQLIITTHSPHFINLDYLEGILLVRKTEEGTYISCTNAENIKDYCIEKGAHRKKTTEANIIPFYSKSSNPNILKGFFACKIILVEGPTEELSLPIYFEKAGLNTLIEGIDIIGVGGKGDLAKWWRFFTHYKIPCYVCFDNDQADDKLSSKRMDFLETLGISDRNLDALIISEDWNVNKSFCVFGINFEETLRNSFSQYSELEASAKQLLGDSKPIIAREVALKLQFDDDEKGWQRIKELIEYIKALKS